MDTVAANAGGSPAAPGEQTFLGGPMGDPTVRSAPAAPAAAPATPAASAETAKPPPDLLEQLRLENERKDGLIRSLLERAPGASDDRVAPAALPKDPGPPPDPVREPDKFKTWASELARFNRGMIAAAVSEGRQEIGEQQLRDRLWTDFRGNYADVAGDEAMCRYAFQAELEASGGRIPADHGRFLEGIATRLRRFRGTQTPAGAAVATAARHEATAGVSAGSDAVKVIHPAGADDPNAKPKPFATQLEETRAKLLPGFF